MVDKLSNRLITMTTRRQFSSPLHLPNAASQSRSCKKDVNKNGDRLPQMQGPPKDVSLKSNRASASKYSSSLSTSGLLQKQTDDQLTSRLSRLTIQNTTHLRKLSDRCGNGPISIDGIASFIGTGLAKKIVVMAGAGISTPSGIPDFRSPGTGLYDNLKQYNIPYPEAIFDIDYFHRNPKPFFTLAKELYPNGKYRPNYVHYFLRMLHEKGLLLRLYTQNIDGLERSAGIPTSKLVEAHGTFMTASCTQCSVPQSSEHVRETIFSDKIPRCHDLNCQGVVKPDIVFFGQDLPKRFFLYSKDFHEADLLIVLGTSLEVEPFAGIVDAVRTNTPRLLFNRELVGPFRPKRRRGNDVASTGDITEQVERFVGLLGWTEELNELIAKSEQATEAVTAGTATAAVTSSKINLVAKEVVSGSDKTDKTVTAERPQAILKVQKNDRMENNPKSKLRQTPFHAQKELYRTNITVPKSDGSTSEDASLSSSDDEPSK